MNRERQELVRRVWLAGLGARALAAREGDDFFRRLVRVGKEVEAHGGPEPALPGEYPWSAGAGSEVTEPAAGLASFEPEVLHFAGILLDRLAEREGRMEEMIDAMLPASSVPSAAAALQARRNAQAREALLGEFGALTSAEVAALVGSRAKNKAALANRWKVEGRIFSVAHKGQTYFPAFQFDAEGKPRPAIAAVASVLAPRVGEWELALWFTVPNGWLGGRRPVDLLESEPEAVAEAARRSTELVF
jgi:hypothetical protein